MPEGTPQPSAAPRTTTAPAQRISRLLQYLGAVVGLRRQVVRSVAQYPEVLWLADVPHDPRCWTRAWSDGAAEDPSMWLSMRHATEPAPPVPPAVCGEWIARKALHDDQRPPTLPESASFVVPNPDYVPDDPDESPTVVREARLSDHPEVQRAWGTYVAGPWAQWQTAHQAWRAVQVVYQQLFQIRQQQLRLAEDFELVLGLGLLVWRTPTGQNVRRHLVVANAELEFNADAGVFSVHAPPNGADLRLELEVLDNARPPEADTADARLRSAGEDPWSTPGVEAALRALVHGLSARGVYRSELARSGVPAGSDAIIEWAPALILRPRSLSAFARALRTIQSQVDAGGDVPPAFATLAEIETEPAVASTDSDVPNEPDASLVDPEIFFPLVASDDQRAIATRLAQAHCVLVQGPPGTGKSHTIANLICHLLATGKRILITAKTPRALQVLAGLLPEPLRPLCVNLLDDGPMARQALEASVRGILNTSQTWNESRAGAERVKRLERLRKLRTEQATLLARLRAIREAETLPQRVADGQYTGTTAAIAATLAKDRDRYGWFVDEVPPAAVCPLDEDTAGQLLAALREVPVALWPEILQPLPEALIDAPTFVAAVSAEADAVAAEVASRNGANIALAAPLEQARSDAVVRLDKACTTLLEADAHLPRAAHPWLDGAARDALAGAGTAWQELERATAQSLAQVGTAAANADAIEVTLPDGATPRRSCADAEILAAHLQGGGSLGHFAFRPPAVRPRTYLVKGARINGGACRSAADFAQLAAALRVRLACADAWQCWQPYAITAPGPYRMQVAALAALRNSLHQALQLAGLLGEVRAAAASVGLATSITTLADVTSVAAACRLAQAREQVKHAGAQLEACAQQLHVAAASAHPHPLVDPLLRACMARDVAGFTRALSTLDAAREQQVRIRHAAPTLELLRAGAPQLATLLAAGVQDSAWDARLAQLPAAWNWARASAWIGDYLRRDDIPALTARLQRVETESQAELAELARLHAWSHCCERLGDAERRHMNAWQDAIRRLGKGTGPNAWRYRAAAQEHLARCSTAVPAWVMPLHRVWDTITPRPGIFDVVIVDEASQCGLEALLLLYLGQRVLIVGDDKQTSPEAVGVPVAQVAQLAQQYLPDFQFANTLGADTSLFEQGRQISQHGLLTLREHFRCMPEIIQFSNALCYQATPLIPLRQHGPDRVPPLVQEYVPGGHREGQGANVVNRPEAEALAIRVAALCEDARYDGKTMGVVTLQGHSQARVIQDLLLERIGAAEMERRQLVCGEAYSFQGAERDVIFLSLVAAPDARIGALTGADDIRRFNVAASRARDALYLFHSVEPNELSPSDLRRQLVEFFEQGVPVARVGVEQAPLEEAAASANRRIAAPPVPFDSWFEVDVALALLRRRYIVRAQVEAAGYRIDLVVEGGRSRLAVECDGDHWHGPERYEADMQRQRQLERCQWQFFRVRESAFRMAPESTLASLWPLLAERGVYPATGTPGGGHPA